MSSDIVGNVRNTDPTDSNVSLLGCRRIVDAFREKWVTAVSGLNVPSDLPPGVMNCDGERAREASGAVS